jgi:hypothetical protein
MCSSTQRLGGAGVEADFSRAAEWFPTGRNIEGIPPESTGNAGVP